MQTKAPHIVVSGPVAVHNLSCPVEHGKPAVLDMNQWVFQPSWSAQAKGWRLVRAQHWWQRIAMKLFFAE